MNTLKDRGHFATAYFWSEHTAIRALLEKHGFECGHAISLDGCPNGVKMNYKKTGTFVGFDFEKSLGLLSPFGFIKTV